MTELSTIDAAAKDTSQTIVDIFKVAASSAETAAITAQPWLGLWFVKPIWTGIFNWIVSLISNGFGICGAYIVMDVQKYFALQTAASALVQLQAAQKSGDLNAITQANAAMDSAVAPILHYVGDAHS